MTTFIIVQLQDYNRIMINTEDIKTIEEHGNGCIIDLIDDEQCLHLGFVALNLYEYPFVPFHSFVL